MPEWLWIIVGGVGGLVGLGFVVSWGLMVYACVGFAKSMDDAFGF